MARQFTMLPDCDLPNWHPMARTRPHAYACATCGGIFYPTSEPSLCPYCDEGATRTTVRVLVRCVACGREHEVGPGEVGPMDVPMCPECCSPCLAVEASRG